MNLKDFAAKLGVSPTTVSRALGGYPEVNEATRERIIEAAARLNYQPNKRARALATGRSFNIGHVLPASSKNELVNPIFGDFIAGVTETCSTCGYNVSLTLSDDDAEEVTYRKFKSEGSVDGVILQGPLIDDRRIDLLRDIGLPFVVHGRASEVTSPYCWVDVNNKRAFERGTKFLLDLGHRDIALINGQEVMDFAYRRRTGYEYTLQENGIDVRDEYLASGKMTEAYGYSATQEMLSLNNPPSAFLMASVISAIGARRAIHEAGLQLGRDVSVITYDDDLSYFSNRQDVPFFTALRSSVREAGNKVADMLLTQIKKPELEPMHELLETELVVGNSTGTFSG